MRTLLTACIISLLPLSAYCEQRPPRVGLALLPLLQPRFPVENARKVLATSDRPTLAFLYGPFGTGPRNALKLVQGLGGVAHVQIYVLSGPTRAPRAKIAGMQDFFKNLPIPHFNRKVANDVEVQEQFRARVLKIKEEIVDPLPHAEFVLVPELEDNLTRGGRERLVSIIHEVFSGYPRVRVRTNPLPLVRTEGVPVETHDPKKIKKLTHGDAFSEDGLRVSHSRSERLIDRALEQGADYYLWRCEWQGTCGGHWRTPERRTYKIRSKSSLIRLLNKAPAHSPTETH